MMRFRVLVSAILLAISWTGESLIRPPYKQRLSTTKSRASERIRMSSADYLDDSVLEKSLLAASSTSARLQMLPIVAGGFTMADLKRIVDAEFLEAGRGTFQEGRGGWNMAAVSQPRGTTFADAKLRYEDVLTAMGIKSGTVVFNSAGGFMPPMATVCLECLEAFEMPTALNMYLTAAGQQVSAPPHTDKQDVFVIQTQGQKHWRVFTPPPPSRMFKSDPFARGKSTDAFELSELDAPLIDTVLGPGQILYVPGGFPHATDTAVGIDVSSTGTSEPSVHMTVGIDTHIWSLTYAGLREVALRRSNVPDKLVMTKAAPDLYWDLQDTLPFGFLQGTDADASRALMIGNMIKYLRLLEEAKWRDLSDEALREALHLEECATVVSDHYVRMTEIFRGMYADVAYKLTNTPADISFLRSKPYFEALDKTMGGLIEWSKSFAEEAEGGDEGKSKKKAKAGSKK